MTEGPDLETILTRTRLWLTVAALLLGALSCVILAVAIAAKILT